MLKDKIVLVTGSSQGIGKAIAQLMSKEGASVIVHGKEDSKELREVAQELNAPFFFCDVADEKAVREAVAQFERIDILVNNAGINPSKTFEELTSEDWQQIFDTNVFGVVNMSKAILPGMKERKQGGIINIASIKGLPFVSGKPAYAASKAAVIRMTSSMAQEFAPYNIRVNAVAPGFVNTEMTEKSMSPAIQKQIDATPLGRMATTEEIAQTVLFFASDMSNYITGQTFVVDGGSSIT